MSDRLNRESVLIDVHRTSPYQYAQTAEPIAETVLASETITVGNPLVHIAIEVPAPPPAWRDPSEPQEN